MDEENFQELMAQLDDPRCEGVRIVGHNDEAPLVVDGVYYDPETKQVVIKLDPNN